MGAVQDAGKKLVSALLGLQSTRAATQPRPFLKLQRQHLAVQACPATSCLQLSPLLHAVPKAPAACAALSVALQDWQQPSHAC